MCVILDLETAFVYKEVGLKFQSNPRGCNKKGEEKEVSRKKEEDMSEKRKLQQELIQGR